MSGMDVGVEGCISLVCFVMCALFVVFYFYSSWCHLLNMLCISKSFCASSLLFCILEITCCECRLHGYVMPAVYKC